MPRRYRPPRRQVEPDPKYGSLSVAQFVNRMMHGGKKSVARNVIYKALDIVEARAKRNPIEVLEQALKNATPNIEVKPRRVGGSTYQIPVEVEPHRRPALAMRWLLAAANVRSGRGMSEKLAAELLDAAQGQGAAVKKKEDTHRMAEANRTFAHYRW
jgi:small subunit ribosomal protein S7